MIVGKYYDQATIAKIESEEISYFHEHASEQPSVLFEPMDYYRDLFDREVVEYANKDNSLLMSIKEQERKEIFDALELKFYNAMLYAFNKGHKYAFAMALAESTKFPNLDEDFFAYPDSKASLILLLDAKTDDDVFENKIERDNITKLINYARRQGLSMYKSIMNYARIFYRKGEGLAFEQIRQDLLHIDYDVNYFSSMTHSPLNQPFRITPAFLGRFKSEQSFVEQWDIVWDESYGNDGYNALAACVTITKYTAGQIIQYSDCGAHAYTLIRDCLPAVESFDPAENVYLIEYIPPLIDPASVPRLLSAEETQRLQDSLVELIVRKIGEPANHFVFA